MLTPAGSNSAAASAAEPCHTPSMRVGDPPTVAANGTVVSMTTVPGFHTPFNCFSRVAWPEKGTVSTATSHWAAAAALSAPSICAVPPMPARSCCAACSARDASREPITMCSPARARRFASPEPSGPVPPKIAIFRAIVALLFYLPLGDDYTRPKGATLRLVCAIFKNFHHGADNPDYIRAQNRAWAIRDRSYRGHRGACPGPRARHDRELLHFRFAGAAADPDLREPERAIASAREAAKTFWREHPEGQSASNLRIFCAHRRKRRDGKTAGHSVSLDGNGHPAPRGGSRASRVQCRCLPCRWRPHHLRCGS